MHFFVVRGETRKMGFGSFLTRARNVGGRLIGKTGAVLKKVGETAAPILRKVGQIGVPVAEGIMGVGAALGQPEIMAAGGLIKKAADWAQGGKVSQLAEKAATIGSRMQHVGDMLQVG